MSTPVELPARSSRAVDAVGLACRGFDHRFLDRLDLDRVERSLPRADKRVSKVIDSGNYDKLQRR